jgi:hypothetical protein
VAEAVRKVAIDLQDWKSNVLGDIEKRIKKVKKELEACRTKCISSSNIAREQILLYKLMKLAEQKDIYWKQRTHAQW